MHEDDKFFTISRILVSDINLISLSEACSRHEHGNRIILFLKNQTPFRDEKINQYLNLWAEAQLNNSTHIVIGECDDDHVMS